MPINENPLLKQELIDFIIDNYTVTDSDIEYPDNTVPNNLNDDTDTILTTATDNGAEIPQNLRNHLNSTDEQIQAYSLKIISEAAEAQKATAQAQASAAQAQADAMQAQVSATQTQASAAQAQVSATQTQGNALQIIADRLTEIERHQDSINNQQITIADKQTTIADKHTIIADKHTIIADKQTLIEQHEKCLCDCCRNSQERTEATLQAALNETGDESTGQEIWDAREDLLRND